MHLERGRVCHIQFQNDSRKEQTSVMKVFKKWATHALYSVFHSLGHCLGCIFVTSSGNFTHNDILFLHRWSVTDFAMPVHMTDYSVLEDVKSEV
jgi:hypothetical protein